MPRTTLSRRGDGGGGNDRWNAAEDFEREARRARNAARAAERGYLATAQPGHVAAPVLEAVEPAVQPAPRADEEATELANGDNGHASSLGDDDAGDDYQVHNSPDPTARQPDDSWSRSGRGKEPPPKRKRKVLRDVFSRRIQQRARDA